MLTSRLRRSTSPRRRVELALLLTAAVWGGTFLTVQGAIRQMEPLSFLAWRFGLSALVLLVVFRRRFVATHRPGAAGRVDLLRAGAVMGLFLTIGYVLQTVGLARTSVSNAAFVTGLFCVLTPVFGFLLFRTPTTATTWVAAGLATAGLYLLTGTSGAFNPADGLVLLGACAFALHVLATGRAVAVGDAIVLTTIQLATCSALSVVGAIATGALAMPPTVDAWLAIGLTGVVAGAGGYAVQTQAQRLLAPAETGLILVSEPVFAGLFAFALNGETLAPLALAGAGVVLGAIALAELGPSLPVRRPWRSTVEQAVVESNPAS